MINKERKLLFFAILAVLLTCYTSCKHESSKPANSKKEINIKEFQKAKKLTGEYFGPTDFFLLPTEIGIFDSVLFVIDFKKDNHFFYFFNKSNFDFIGSAIKRGRGPDEFGAIEFFHQYSKNNIWVLDPIGRKFSLLNLNSMLASQSFIPAQSYQLHPNLGIVLSMFYISDNLLVGTTRSGVGRLFLWNPENDSIKIVEKFPEIEKFKNIPQRDLGKIYHSYNGIKPDKKLIVSAMDLFKRLDIFTINGDLYSSLLFPEFNKLEHLPSSKEYYEETVY